MYRNVKLTEIIINVSLRFNDQCHSQDLQDSSWPNIYMTIFQTPCLVYKGSCTVYGQLHFCLEEQENPGKTSGKQEEGERKNHATQLVQRWSSISFNSSLSKPSTSRSPCLRLTISRIIGILHLFSLSRVK